MQSKIDTLTREKNVLENILENLEKKHLVEIDDLKQKLQLKTKEEYDAQKVIEQLRRELSDLHSGNALVRSLKAEIQELEARDKKQIITIKQLEEEVNRLSRLTPTSTTKVVDRTDYNTLKRLEEENESLRLNDNKNLKIISQLKSEISGLRLRLDNHSETDGYKSVTIMELKQTIANLREELRTLRFTPIYSALPVIEPVKVDDTYRYDYYDDGRESYFNP